MRMGGQHHAPAVLPPGKDPVPIVQKAKWAPGPVWTGAEYLATTGIRSPDRPDRTAIAKPTELSGPQISRYSLIIQASFQLGFVSHIAKRKSFEW
jgi:hypothetical protein